MNKIITPLVLSFFFLTAAHSQPITLHDTGLIPVSKDTVGRFNDLSIVSFVGTPATNATWDLSQAQYNYPVTGYYDRQAPFAGNSYPTASFSRRNYIFFGILDNLQLQDSYLVDSSGVAVLGRESLFFQAISRRSVTGDSYDSLFFPAQMMPYSRPLKDLAFPATMGSIWGDSISYPIQLYVNSRIGNLLHAPLVLTKHFFKTDTVVGWGKMRVRMPDSTKLSDYVPVLQIHELGVETDSFFMNNGPAPDSILNYLGLYQGYNKAYYSTRFLRVGEIESMLTTTFIFPSQTLPLYAIATLMRLPVSQTNGVKALKAGRLALYPNPSRTRELRVLWPGASGNMVKYSFVDFAGRQMAAGEVQLDQLLKLPQSMPAGIYSLTLIDSDGARESTPLVLE